MVPLHRRDPLVDLLAVLVAGVGAAAAFVFVGPLLTIGATGAFALAALAGAWPRLLTRAWLVALGVVLAGYTVMGRGLAYLGVPPVFIGELLLVVGLVIAVRRATVGALVARWLLAPWVAFVVIGVAATLPYVGVHGLDTLRDAVTWGYALFAAATYVLIRRTGWVDAAFDRYRRFVPWFLWAAPVAVVAYYLFHGWLPRWPISGVPIINPKGGDVAVHLAGAMAFLALGLHHAAQGARAGPRPSTASERPPEGRDWLLWGMWTLGVVAVANVRAALLTLAITGIGLVTLYVRARVGKAVAIVAFALVVSLAFDLRFDLGSGREVSADGIVQAITSVVAPVGESVYDGSRQWRLNWWTDIVEYTLFGDYFWTGKGYGINLANADGYQVHGDDSLRSPHNGHLTILARSGVPGAVAWLWVVGAFGVLGLRTLRRARRAGATDDVRRLTWLLVYGAAFLVNAAFDVFLEGPQGGIWFWCLWGYAAATVEDVDTRLRARRAVRPEYPHAPPQGRTVVS